MKRKILLFAMLVLALSCVVVMSACGPAEPADTTTAATTTAATTTASTTTLSSTVPTMTFLGGEFTYDGTAVALAVEGAPEGSVITYTVNGEAADAVSLVDAGTYEIVATVNLPAAVYNPSILVQTLTATVVINPAAADMSAVAFPAENTSVFDNTVKTFAVTGLPSYVDVAYTYAIADAAATEMKNAATYTVTATFTSTDANYVIAAENATLTATYTITPATADFTGVAFPTANSFVFNNAAKAFELETLPAYVSVTYAYAKDGAAVDAAVNVGTYTVVATLVSTDANYIIAAEDAIKTADFTITPATADLSAVAFPAGNSFVFNDEAKTFELAGLPAYVTATYAYTQGGNNVNAAVNVGTYTVTATLVSTDANYVIAAEDATKTATFTIAPQAFDMSGVAFFPNNSSVYNGQRKDYGVIGLSAIIIPVYSYSLNGEPVEAMIDVGTYTVTVTFISADENYGFAEGEDTMTATFTITPADAVMDDVAFPAGNTAVYNGEPKTFEVVGLPSYVGVTYTYTLNGEAVDEIKDAGTYTVTATFTSTDANYVIPADKATLTATYTVSPATIDVSDIVLKGAEGYVVDGPFKTEIVIPAEIADLVSYTFTIQLGDAAPTEGNSASEVGVYTVKYVIVSDNANYVIEGDAYVLTATITIKALETFDMSEVIFSENGYNATYGALDALNIALKNLPEGLEVTFKITDGENEYAISELGAGSYTVVAVFTKLADDAYTYYAIPEAMTTTLNVAKKSVTIADLGLGTADAWNYANAQGYNATEGAIEYYDGIAIEMTLTDEALAILADAGLTVTGYATTKDGVAVDNTVTTTGTYTTVVTIAPANDNYEVTDAATVVSIVWGVFTDNWSPIV